MSWYSRALSRAMAARPARSSARANVGRVVPPAGRAEASVSTPRVRPRAAAAGRPPTAPGSPPGRTVGRGRVRRCRGRRAAPTCRRPGPARPRRAGRRAGRSGLAQPADAGPPVGRSQPGQFGPPRLPGSPASVTPARSARNGTACRARVCGGGVRVEGVGQGAADLGQEVRPPGGLLGGRPLGPLLGQGDPLLGLPADLLGHPEQVDEHPHLGPQDLRDDRREDVVHRPVGVPLGRPHLVGEGGQEDDRRVRRPLALADQARPSRTRPCRACSRRAG